MLSREVRVLAPGETSPNELRALRAWLIREDELRGMVRLLESEPEDGRLGLTADALQIAAGSASTALAASLIAWIRSRTGRVRILVKGPGGQEVELNAATVRALDAKAISNLSEKLVAAMAVLPPESPETEAERPR